jgi:hypothetical protein
MMAVPTCNLVALECLLHMAERVGLSKGGDGITGREGCALQVECASTGEGAAATGTPT